MQFLNREHLVDCDLSITSEFEKIEHDQTELPFPLRERQLSDLVSEFWTAQRRA